MAIDVVTLALAKGYTDESEAEAIEQTYADNGVLGAKNLLPQVEHANTTVIINDVTITSQEDGSVLLNGTSSDAVSYHFIRLSSDANRKFIKQVAGKKVILSGTNVSNTDVRVQFWSTKTNVIADTTGKGTTFTIPSDLATTGDYNFAIWIPSGTIINNVIAYPMLRLASDTDSTYVPYAMTNRELTEKVKNTGTYALGMIVAAVTPSNGKQPEFFIPWYNPDLKNATFSFTIRMRGASTWEEITQESAIGVQNVSKNGFLVNANLQTALTSNTTFTFRLDGSITF